MRRLWRRVWIILLCYVNAASSEFNIRGFVGEEVLLPCVYRGDDPLPEKVSVYWRDKDDNSVLDIITPNVTSQSQIFRDRASSFPHLYQKGNFSIVLRSLRQSDSGPYDCHIPKLELKQRVRLTVAGKRVEVAATPTPGPAVGNAAVMPAPPLLSLLSASVFLLCRLK
ncbi:CD276 antigen homolog isoform X2 [Xiphias gladius]|uniref:CD276 antigen homolog isoform X2 n=1 Tax=Xiphias gladius TaxID=8245 RepID=UPI001A997317|nr:CD276 antigen homolog isoform X2 [Xiphias gladius]